MLGEWEDIKYLKAVTPEAFEGLTGNVNQALSSNKAELELALYNSQIDPYSFSQENYDELLATQEVLEELQQTILPAWEQRFIDVVPEQIEKLGAYKVINERLGNFEEELSAIGALSAEDMQTRGKMTTSARKMQGVLQEALETEFAEEDGSVTPKTKAEIESWFTDLLGQHLKKEEYHNII